MSLTNIVTSQIDMAWSTKIREENEKISAMTLDEVIEYLNDTEYQNSIDYFIRRYIMNHLREDTSNKNCYTVNFNNKKYTFTVIPDKNIPCSETEINSYIKLLEDMASKHEIPVNVAGGLRFNDIMKKGRIPSSREAKFQLTFILGMNSEEVCKFFDILNENPYNFRNPYENIYYFCQSLPAFNGYDNWKWQQKLRTQYDRLPSVIPSRIADNPPKHTSIIKHELDSIVDIKLSISDEERIKRLLQLLESHQKDYINISLSARELFCQKLNEVRDYMNAISEIEKKECTDNQEDDNKYYSPAKSNRALANRMYNRCLIANGNQYFYKLKLIKLPESIWKHWLKHERMSAIKNTEKPIAVTKKDILFLYYYLYPVSDEFMEREKAVTEDEKRKWIKNYIKKVNCELNNCGFCSLYPPNPFDRLILLAFYSPEPKKFFDNIIRASYDMVELEELEEEEA